MAATQRQEFVHLFLQGRWCEAAPMFERSTEAYLLRDDFCAAAQNYVLAWKLSRYLGLEDARHLTQARSLLRSGRDCPDVALPSSDRAPDKTRDEAGPNEAGPDEKDRAYRSLLAAGRLETAARHLAAEPDQLYASVYGRKTARAAMDAHKPALARTILEQTRKLDAGQGWILFLIQDWRMLHELTSEAARKEEILGRVERLQDLIQPCPW